jgi:ribokinase
MRAICIGSAMVDIITIVESRDVERMTMHNDNASFLLLEQGRKIEAESISEHVGGGAINAAVSMTRLGLQVSPIVKLGQDSNGDQILDRLQRENVDAQLVIRLDGQPTGTAVMVSSHDRNATIFTQRGTNTLLLEEDFPAEKFAGVDLVFVSNLSNRSSDSFPLIAKRARNAGAFVAANPGIRQLTSRTASLFDSLPNIDLLAINRVEAEALIPALVGRLGDPAFGRGIEAHYHVDGAPARLIELGLSYGSFTMEFGQFMAAMVFHGQVGRMLVTDGTHGAYLADQTGLHYCPALAVEPKGTAGAGDAFTSTVSTFLAGGHDAGEALQAGACNSASVVAEVDTQMGLLTEVAINKARLAEQAQLATAFWPWAGE